MTKPHRFFLFLLLTIIIALNCSKNNRTEVNIDCKSIKLQSLLDEVFRKSYLYPIMNSFVSGDSSIRYNYLTLKNLPEPTKQYYIRTKPLIDSVKIDSVRLILKKDLKTKKDANEVFVSLLETNHDTSSVKILVDYGSIENIALREATYSFNYENCKWIMKDSVFWTY
jgi:hypothetical protein